MEFFLVGLIRAIERVTVLFGHVGAWIVLVLIVAMDYEVIMRYAFGSPTSWAFEIGYMLMGASFLFTIAFAMITKSHVRVDFIYGALQPKRKALIDFVGYTFFLLPLVAWTTYGLGNYLISAFVSGETSGESAWNPVIWPFRVTFVVGFALFSAQIFSEILKCILVFMGRDVPSIAKHLEDEES